MGRMWIVVRGSMNSTNSTTLGFPGRRVEIADETALPGLSLPGHRDAIGDGLLGTLNRRGGDAEAVSAAVGG